jgi:hypothetical protein
LLISQSDWQIQVETWCFSPPARTKAVNKANTNTLVPTKAQVIAITANPTTLPDLTQTPYVLTGAPLVLEFDKIFMICSSEHGYLQ